MPFVYGPRQTFLRYFQYDKKLTRDVKEKALMAFILPPEFTKISGTLKNGNAMMAFEEAAIDSLSSDEIAEYYNQYMRDRRSAWLYLEQRLKARGIPTEQNRDLLLRFLKKKYNW